MDDMFGMLYSGLKPTKQFLTAVSCNMIDSLNKLLEEKMVNIDSKLQEQSGNTALHICAQKGNSSCLKFLLDRGANPDCVSDFGLTPIAMALRNGHCYCVELLLKTGSSLSDPSFIWQSIQLNEIPTWVGYSTDVLQILLIASPDFRENGSDITQVMYQTFLRTVQCPELIKLFFLSGNRLSNEEWRFLIENVQKVPNTDLLQWLIPCKQCVPSLQHQARLAIRRSLTPNVLHGAVLLPVPPRLQKYLLFPEVPRASRDRQEEFISTSEMPSREITVFTY